ncbi:MAG: hypothetical protein HYZ29_18665 [Myxococcales bacterium]|nr:hypothetical protein [Myxococcales bacterium]
MRALKLLTSFVAWRWTPCVALIGSSLLYVLIVVLVTPKSLSFGGPPSKAVNVIEGPDPTNALAPARGASRREPTAPAPPAMAPVMAAPPTPVAPLPPPPAPAEEVRRAEPPPPPTPTPAAPDPAEADDEPHAAPPPPINARDRALSAPLRMMPQLTANPNTAPPPSE